MLSTDGRVRPLLSFNSILQSNLRLAMTSEHRRRQVVALVAYGTLVTAASLLALVLQPSDGAKARLLGASFPGARFLHWAGDGQVLACLILFGAGLVAFLATLVLWFATGNVIAPVATWSILAGLAAEPAMLRIDSTKTADWPFAIGAVAFLLLAMVWLRQGVRRSSPRAGSRLPLCRGSGQAADEDRRPPTVALLAAGERVGQPAARRGPGGAPEHHVRGLHRAADGTRRK